MSVHITGSVIAPQAVRNHTEPTAAVEAGNVGAGQNTVVNIGFYHNSGNVAQTLVVADPTDLVGCTFINYDFRDGDSNINGNTVTLEVGKQVELLVSVHPDERAFGADPEAMSLNIPSAIWS